MKKIEMPTETEKKRSIEMIISNSIPHKKSFVATVGELVSDFGVRNVFRGIEDCILTAFIICSIGFFFWEQLSVHIPNGGIEPHFTLFILTPVFYAVVTILSLWKENSLHVSELQKTCKYTPKHLVTFRMAAFSLVNMLLIIPPAFMVSEVRRDAVFLKLILVAMSSLFIYSFITAFTLFYSGAKTTVITPAAWFVLLEFLKSVTGETIEEFLVNTSIVTFVICVIISAGIYFIVLDNFIKKGGKGYAYS